MNLYNQIIENFNDYSTCLSELNKISSSLKHQNHILIFSYLIGYFSKMKIAIDDLHRILEKYKNDFFDKCDFLSDFKKIAFIFCKYFEDKNNNPINGANNNPINDNINNVLASSFTSNCSGFNIFSSNPNIQNFNLFDDSPMSPKKVINIINGVDYSNDLKMAKQLEEEEKIFLQIQQEKDSLNQKKKCEICLEEFSLLDCTNYFLNCNCILHNKCFDEMVRTAVENNTLPVKCPNCGIPVHPNYIEDSLRNANPQLLDKYQKFSMNNFILNNLNEYSSCPTPGCEYMFFFNPGEHDFICPLCGKHYCLNCKDEWHQNMTCQQYRDSKDVNKLDQQFYQFVKGAKFKMCPKCKYWMEKNQGCNHMRCRCGADFCYKCGDLMDQMEVRRGHKCKK